MIRHTSLRQLEIFQAVAQFGSFTKAASILFLTQPTISMQMKKLTDSIGLPLFEHVGKKLYLTVAGRELEKTCRSIFADFNRFEMLIADMKGLKQGVLRLAVVTTAQYFAPRLLGPFCERYPGIEVMLTVSNREIVVSRLAENQDDLYILGQPPDEVETMNETFLEIPLVVLAPAHHPLSHRKKITLDRIAKEPFIMREPGSGTRAATERIFAANQLRLNVRMELGSNEAIKQAVIGGLGVSVLSKHTLMQEVQLGRLVILDVEEFPILRYWYVAHPIEKQLSIVSQTFLDYLKKEAKNINQDP